jgi:hypothetical protein
VFHVVCFEIAGFFFYFFNLVLLGTCIALLDDGETDSLVLGERDKRFVLIAQNEDVGCQSGPDVTTGVADLDDLLRSRVGLAGNDDSNATNVATAGGHAEVTNVELDESGELSGGQIDLNDVVDTDIGVRITDGASVVGSNVRHTSGEQANLLNAAELEGSLLGEDSVEDEASLGVIQQTEVLVGALDVDDVHEAGREDRISTDLTVNSNETLHQDQGNLTAGQGVLESVAEKDHQGQALTELVGSRAGTRSLYIYTHTLRQSRNQQNGSVELNHQYKHGPSPLANQRNKIFQHRAHSSALTKRIAVQRLRSTCRASSAEERSGA